MNWQAQQNYYPQQTMQYPQYPNSQTMYSAQTNQQIQYPQMVQSLPTQEQIYNKKINELRENSRKYDEQANKIKEKLKNKEIDIKEFVYQFQKAKEEAIKNKIIADILENRQP